MKFELPIRTVSSANAREHWAVKAKRAKSERKVTYIMSPRNMPKPPLTVILTRIGKRKLDSDNLAISFKHIRDELAKMLGVDDGSDAVEWRYQQEKAKRYAVIVELIEHYRILARQLNA